ncbi:MAG TPA: lanthionine synthetase LanC family protein [Thermoanaerobaculia bacterium]|jgi:lantibiotic modifying enzyme
MVVSDPPSLSIHPQPASEHRAVFLETAASLGARICRDALWGDGVCNWIGFSMEHLGGRWRHVHRAYGGELYGGTSGIALFLARLHAATGERIFRRTALGAIRHALEHGAGEIAPPARVGAYSGWTGLADAALQIGSLLDDGSLREPALALLEEAAGTDSGRNFDLLAGCAGAIPLLLRAHGRHGGPAALAEAAARLGDHLRDTAARDDAGWSWGEFGTPGVRQKGNLLGFSHGAGGIGWALLELHHATGEERFREAGEGAFRYERHWFDAEHGNWPDLRDPETSGLPASDAPAFMTAWCHGAAGVGLSRLRVWEMSGGEGDEETRKEAEVAVATTLENLRGGTEMSQTNDCLCHGRGGNCETLIYGAQVLGRPEWLRRAEEIGLRQIETCAAQRLPWPCGTYGAVEVPGLMLGLAGIGYFYLRLADPAGTPMVVIPVP